MDHVDDDDKLNSKMLSSFELDLGQRGGWLVNESGLYSLILSSKLPSAKRLKNGSHQKFYQQSERQIEEIELLREIKCIKEGTNQ